MKASAGRPLELGRAVRYLARYEVAKKVALGSQRWQGGLKGQPRVALERPTVLVPGFGSRCPSEELEPLVDHLGPAYYVKEGRFYSDPTCDTLVPNPDGDQKFFRMVPTHPFLHPTEAAEGLAQGLEAIRSLHPGPPDAIGHSMGGLTLRTFLDQNDERLGQVGLAGTPHQGSRMATTAWKVLTEEVGWAIALSGLPAVAVGPLSALRCARECPDANPFLDDLNSRFEAQRAKTEGFLTVGVEGYTTPGFTDRGVETGDGLVAKSSLILGDAPVKMLGPGRTRLHHTMMSDPDVFQAFADHFNWGPNSCQDVFELRCR